MFRRLAWVGAQDEDIAGRFRTVGVEAERIEVMGSVKWDTAQVGDSVAGTEALASALGIDADRPLWVCGSTGHDEEPLLVAGVGDCSEGVSGCAVGDYSAEAGAVRPGGGDDSGCGYSCVRRSETPDGSSPGEAAVRP